MASAFAACAAALIISFELPGCTPQYWVPGLNLPPGSNVTSRTETTTTPGAFPGPIPFIGTPDRTLMIQFTNPAGWSVVSSHIDGCMKSAGYADTMSGLAGMMGGAYGMSGAGASPGAAAA